MKLEIERIHPSEISDVMEMYICKRCESLEEDEEEVYECEKCKKSFTDEDIETFSPCICKVCAQDKPLQTFRVNTTIKTTLTTTIEASSLEEAWEIAREADGGEFTEFEDSGE